MKLYYVLMIGACCYGMEEKDTRLQVTMADDESSMAIDMPAPRDPKRIFMYQEQQHHLPPAIVEQIHPNAQAAATDTIPRKQHQKWLAITNSITGVITAAIGAAVTLAVHFSSKCPPNPPTGTP